MIEPRIPGGPSLPEIPGGRYDPDRTGRLRDEIFAIASDTQAKIAQPIAQNLADVQAVCASIQAKYLGQAGVTLDSIRAVCDRIASKIKAGLVTKWAEVEAYINAAGFTLGDIANASYPNASGRNVPPMGGQNASALPSPGGSLGNPSAGVPPTPYGGAGSYGRPGQTLSQTVADPGRLTTLDGGGIQRDPYRPDTGGYQPPIIDPVPGYQPPTVPMVPTSPTPGGGTINPGYQPPGDCLGGDMDPDNPACPPCPPGGRPPDSYGRCGCCPPGSGPVPMPTSITGYGCGMCGGSLPPPQPPTYPPPGSVPSQGYCPPPAIVVNCSSCGQPPTSPCGPACPPGYHWQPDTTSPTLVGGGGGDGPFGPTLRGGGGGDLPFAGDPGNTTLRGGGIMLTSNEPIQSCEPIVTGGYVESFAGPLGWWAPGIMQQRPWTNPGSNPPGLQVTTCVIDRCHFIPPRDSDLVLYYPVGWVVKIVSGGTLVALSADVSGVNIFPAPCGSGSTQPVPPAPVAPGAGGQCVPNPPDPDADKCPVKKDLPCGDDAKVPKIPGMEEPFDPCKAIADALVKIKADGTSIAEAMRIKTEKGDVKNSTLTNVVMYLLGTTESGALPALFGRFAEWLDKFVKQVASDQSCDTASLLPVVTKRAIVHLINKYTDTIPEQLIRELEQVSNSICQSRLPSGSEADRAWLFDQITDEEWECYHKAEGNFLSPMRKVVQAARTQPTVKEWITLFRREEITDVELIKKLRGHGVIDIKEQEWLYSLSEQRPPISDLIRFMVRDVFDEQVVSDGQLDKNFADKWTDEAKKLGKAIGVTDGLAKQYWRAHWQYPSYTQLREMLYRLRPDKYPGDMAVDIGTMQKALEVDDHAPGFVKRLIEVAYHPLLTTDAERMYQVRQIDETALAGVYMDHGYKEDVAAAKVEYSKLQRQFYDLQRAGFPSLSELNRLYGQCLIDAGTLEDGIQRWVTSDEQAAEAIETAEIRRSITERRMLIQRIQKEYRYGLIDDGQATSELAEGGIDPGCISGLVRRFRSQRQRQPKQAAASTLCKWFAHGIVTADQFLEALIRQGWNTDDALRIVRECEYEQAERQRKAQEAAAAKATRVAEREAKAAAKAAKPTRKKGSQGG